MPSILENPNWKTPVATNERNGRLQVFGYDQAILENVTSPAIFIGQGRNFLARECRFPVEIDVRGARFEGPYAHQAHTFDVIEPMLDRVFPRTLDGRRAAAEWRVESTDFDPLPGLWQRPLLQARPARTRDAHDHRRDETLRGRRHGP